MRIINLTPGTGTWHCGACLRDSTLVTALRQAGHDAIIVPMYLPLVTEDSEPSVGAPLFFGGINIYLQHKSRFFRHTPRWLDCLLDLPPLLRAVARRAGMTSPAELGALTSSMLRGEQGQQRKELRRLSHWLATQEKPDVICLSNALLLGLARDLKQSVGAPLLCTLQGEDTFLDSLPEPWRTECWALLRERAKDVDGFLPVSFYYRDVMAERLQLASDRLRVVYNGVACADFTPSSLPFHPPVIGFFARMCRAKGLETLIEAFILIKQEGQCPGVKLHVGGTQTAEDRVFVQRLQQRLHQHGLLGDVLFFPNLDRAAKREFFQKLTVLSVPATYGESFGLYVIEALAAGVPVVQPRRGAFPEILEATGGGLLCEPDDPRSLAEGIVHLLRHPDEARAMGERGRRVVQERFTAERMAAEFLSVASMVRGQESPPDGQAMCGGGSLLGKADCG